MSCSQEFNYKWEDCWGVGIGSDYMCMDQPSRDSGMG